MSSRTSCVVINAYVIIPEKTQETPDLFFAQELIWRDSKRIFLVSAPGVQSASNASIMAVESPFAVIQRIDIVSPYELAQMFHNPNISVNLSSDQKACMRIAG